jgi:hypothetical protein
MKTKDLLKLNDSEKKELEKFIVDRIVDIIFKERKRPSGKSKADGSGLIITNQTGKLKRSVEENARKGFMKLTKKGYVFDLRFAPYYKYLDDARKDELNWYLTEAIFEDDEIAKKVAELVGKGIKANFLEIISEELKQIKP